MKNGKNKNEFVNAVVCLFCFFFSELMHLHSVKLRQSYFDWARVEIWFVILN